MCFYIHAYIYSFLNDVVKNSKSEYIYEKQAARQGMLAGFDDCFVCSLLCFVVSLYLYFSTSLNQKRPVSVDRPAWLLITSYR